jgi:hypothetical protein
MGRLKWRPPKLLRCDENHKENKMKTKNTPNPMLARSPEPFEEVWMFPEGWDLSEMDEKPATPGMAEQDSLPVDQLLFLRTKLNV